MWKNEFLWIFKNILVIYLNVKASVRKAEGELSHLLILYLDGHNDQGWARSQEPRVPSRSHPWVPGAQIIGPSSDAFPDIMRELHQKRSSWDLK